jgi:hypothetical protein
VLEPDPERAVDYGLFSVRQARAAGFSRADIERQVRRGVWNRRARGVLELTGRAAQPFDAVVCARLTAGPGAVVGFESAAQLLGWDLQMDPPQPRLIVPPKCSNRLGYRMILDSEDVMLHGVIALTGPLRTALDVACSCAFDAAAITLDSALRSGQVSIDELHARFHSVIRPGIRSARHVLSSVDAGSGSVPESEARLLFASAGLPAPTTQFVVRDGHRFIARLDFAWEEALLAVEIDGFAYHSASGDFQRDRSRQNIVQLQGWLVLRFTVADIRDNPDEVVAQIRSALAQRVRPA